MHHVSGSLPRSPRGTSGERGFLAAWGQSVMCLPNLSHHYLLNASHLLQARGDFHILVQQYRGRAIVKTKLVVPERSADRALKKQRHQECCQMVTKYSPGLKRPGQAHCCHFCGQPSAAWMDHIQCDSTLPPKLGGELFQEKCPPAHRCSLP